VDGAAPSQHTRQTQSANTLVTQFPWTPAQVYGTTAYWLIVIGGFACQFPFFFFTAHWILHLRQHGLTASDAAWAMGLFTVGAIGGRLIGGWLMDIMRARFAFMSGLCCYFLGSFLAIKVDSGGFPVAIAAALLYGVGFGWTFSCMTTMTGHYFGPSAFPKVNGMVLLLSGLVGSPAGLIGGKLFDHFGNYVAAFELNILVAAIGILALAFAHMPKFSGAPDAATAQTLAKS